MTREVEFSVFNGVRLPDMSRDQLLDVIEQISSDLESQRKRHTADLIDLRNFPKGAR